MLMPMPTTQLLERRASRASLLSRVLDRALHDPDDAQWEFRWGDQVVAAHRLVWQDKMVICGHFPLPNVGDDLILLVIDGQEMLARSPNVNDPSVAMWLLDPGE